MRGRLVRGNLLRVLKGTAVFKISGDAGCAGGVAADLGFDPSGLRTPPDHPPCVGLCERVERRRPALLIETDDFSIEHPNSGFR